MLTPDARWSEVSKQGLHATAAGQLRDRMHAKCVLFRNGARQHSVVEETQLENYLVQALLQGPRKVKQAKARLARTSLHTCSHAGKGEIGSNLASRTWHTAAATFTKEMGTNCDGQAMA